MENLTSHQKEKLDAMLSDDSDIVMLAGEAGTGKSFTITEFISSLQPNQSIALLGTTHKSLAVLGEMLGTDTSCRYIIETVHKFFNYRVSDSEGSTSLVKNPKKGMYDDTDFDYIIVDEVSMLPRAIFDDLKEYSKNKYSFKKIIFIGDPIQLQIDEFLRLSSVPMYELTDNMRQETGNDLLPYLQKLRTDIKEVNGPSEMPHELDNLSIYYDHTKFLHAYRNSSHGDKKIIAYKNQTVDAYNRNIKRFIQKKDKWSLGDELILHGPVIYNKKQVFTNRSSVEITSEPKPSTKHGINSTGFEITGRTGHKAYVYIPDTKTSLKERLQPLVDSKNWAKYYEIKESFSYAAHSYSLTAHSSQGSSYSEVWVDISDFNPPNDPTFDTLLRLIYVALSRTKGSAHVFLGDDRDYSALGKE